MPVLSTIVLHGTFILALLTLASLSRIFGAARKKKPRYRLFYLSSGLVFLAMIFNLLGFNIVSLSILALVLDVAALVVGCAVTYFYWDWLPREISRG